MADMNGKAPEQLAKDIVNDATKTVTITISGVAAQKLATVVRYLNRETIAARSQKWFESNEKHLTTDAVETLISSREKAIVEYLAKKEQAEADKDFHMLLKRGLSIQDAYKAVYNKQAEVPTKQ